MKPAALLPLLVCTVAIAEPTAYESARQAMTRRVDAERKTAANNPDVKVWDFVVADKKAKTVTLLACATQIRHDDPVEFFVSPFVSGKDYESLTVTFAKPADVQAAMAFIGLKPGRAIDPKLNRFWARGPRVVMTLKPANGVARRSDDYVLNARTHTPLTDGGLVYTGSTSYADPQGKERRVADDSDAGPIASVYSEPAALFDVPRQSPQSETYGKLKPGPAFAAKPGDLFDVILSPAAGDDAVADFDLQIGADWVDGRIQYLTMNREDPAGRDDAPGHLGKIFPDLPRLMAYVAEQADGRRNLFTRVSAHPQVPVSDLRKLYAVLEAVEKDRGVKLDANAPGELFHRAFFPEPAWRDRSTRLGEPWELFLTRDAAGNVVAKLERQTDDPDATPRVRVQTTRPADPAAMADYVQANATQWSRALFIFPPPDLTYGELLAWTRPVADALPRVFVFPQDAPATRPAE